LFRYDNIVFKNHKIKKISDIIKAYLDFMQHNPYASPYHNFSYNNNEAKEKIITIINQYIIINQQKNIEIIKKDNGREELFKGCIVLAQKKDKEENPNKPYVIEGYDVVKAIVRDQNNAGFVAKHNHSISGLVWIDEDHDGICNEETFAKGVDITLEKLYLQNGQWLTMDSEAFVTVQTGVFCRLLSLLFLGDIFLSGYARQKHRVSA